VVSQNPYPPAAASGTANMSIAKISRHDMSDTTGRPFASATVRVGPNDAAAGAHHARTERWHWNFIRPRVGAQHRLVVANPTRHRERPHAVLAHVAEGHWVAGDDEATTIPTQTDNSLDLFNFDYPLDHVDTWSSLTHDLWGLPR
jgi:hypothetical protein